MIRLCALAAPGADVLEQCARLGLWGAGAVLSPEATAADARALGQRHRAAGLRLIHLVDERDLTRPEAVPALRRALDLAAAAGALGVATSAGSGEPGLLDAVARHARAVLAAQPGEEGPRLLLRPRRGSPVDSLLGASEAVRRVAHPRFGLLFDPVDLLSIDTYFDNGSFLRRCVQQWGPALAVVQARDALLHPGGFDFSLSLEAVGAGALDYPALLQALDGLSGDVPLVVAGADGAEALEAAAAHLRAAAARAAVALG